MREHRRDDALQEHHAKLLFLMLIIPSPMWMNTRQQMTKKQANKSGMGSLRGTPVHIVKNTTILDQLPCLQMIMVQPCCTATDLKIAMGRKRREKWRLWVIKLRGFLQWGVVLCPAVVNCRCALYFCILSPHHFQRAIYPLWLGADLLCYFFYILGSSGFSAPESSLVSCQCF